MRTQKTESELQKWVNEIQRLVKIRDEASAQLEALFARITREKERRQQFKITADGK